MTDQSIPHQIGVDWGAKFLEDRENYGPWHWVSNYQWEEDPSAEIGFKPVSGYLAAGFKSDENERVIWHFYGFRAFRFVQREPKHRFGKWENLSKESFSVSGDVSMKFILNRAIIANTVAPQDLGFPEDHD